MVEKLGTPGVGRTCAPRIRAIGFVGATYVLVSLSPPSVADSPAPARDSVVCSRNSRYCLVVLVGKGSHPYVHPEVSFDPGLRATYSESGLYRSPTTGSSRPELLSSIDAMRDLPNIVLDDGEHLICVRAGDWLQHELHGSETALVFYRRGSVTRRWSVAELVPNWSSLPGKRSASHVAYEWLCQVQLSPDERTLEVTPCPAGLAERLFPPQSLRFDAHSGARR